MDLEKIAHKGYQFTNWSRTFTCSPEAFYVPTTVDEIREILYLAKSERKRIRVVGCGASPSDICLSTDFMISLAAFNHVLHVDRDEATVTVQGGIKLVELNRFLEQNGLAMPILGSISDSTIAGVISVGTHGTGFATGIIADYVLELRLIVPSGDIVVCSRDAQSELFLSALCGLGALGIILEVTLQCEPKFYLHQLTYPSTLDHVLDNLDELVESSDHFRFLWFPHTDFVSVSVTNKINGAFLQLTDIDYHSRRRLSGQDVTDHGDLLLPVKLSSEKTWLQKALDWILNYGIGYHVLQVAYWASTYIPSLVPYINRAAFWALYSTNSVQLDVSYKIFNFECLFDQYVNEWSIPRSQTSTVLRELRETIEQSLFTSAPLYAHFPVEVRFARPSDIYLSPTFGRDSTYINIICYRPYRKFVEHQAYWDHYEAIVKRNGGRPHWAKQHRETVTSLVRMYPYLGAWIQVRRRLDPLHIFSNAYLDRIFNADALSNTSKASLFARRNYNRNHFDQSATSATEPAPESLNTSWSSVVSTETAEIKMDTDRLSDGSIETILTNESSDDQTQESISTGETTTTSTTT